jgi:DNA 3'-phosphatase
MQLNKAVFMNLDNTVVKTKSGEQYFKDANDWEFIGGFLPKLKVLVDAGYIPCVVSNQAGVSTGNVLETILSARMKNIEQEMEQYLGCSVNFAYCTQLESYNRKPYPGMAYYIAMELYLSLRRSIMIGCSKVDSDFAKEAYIGTYYDIEDFLHDTDLDEYIKHAGDNI